MKVMLNSQRENQNGRLKQVKQTDTNFKAKFSLKEVEAPAEMFDSYARLLTNADKYFESSIAEKLKKNFQALLTKAPKLDTKQAGALTISVFNKNPAVIKEFMKTMDSTTLPSSFLSSDEVILSFVKRKDETPVRKWWQFWKPKPIIDKTIQEAEPVVFAEHIVCKENKLLLALPENEDPLAVYIGKPNDISEELNTMFTDYTTNCQLHDDVTLKYMKCAATKDLDVNNPDIMRRTAFNTAQKAFIDDLKGSIKRLDALTANETGQPAQATKLMLEFQQKQAAILEGTRVFVKQDTLPPPNNTKSIE